MSVHANSVVFRAPTDAHPRSLRLEPYDDSTCRHQFACFEGLFPTYLLVPSEHLLDLGEQVAQVRILLVVNLEPDVLFYQGRSHLVLFVEIFVDLPHRLLTAC